MDFIDDAFGTVIARTVFSSEVYFYSLFVFIYDRMYGLGSKLAMGVRIPKLDQNRLRNCILEVSSRVREGDVPDEVLDSIIRASADTGRRGTRHNYLVEMCDGATR
jgi:hypothetical protein